MSGAATLAIVIPAIMKAVLPETRRRIVGLIRGLVEADKISEDSTIYCGRRSSDGRGP
jgi:alcohol dehydrogenase YqhD (iron-dependent ADH family)